MSTLKQKDFQLMDEQINHAKGKTISKEKVLSILHLALREADLKNDFTVDRIDGIAIKDIINDINNL